MDVLAASDTLRQQSTDELRTSATHRCAIVSVGAIDTTYERLGAGSAVILLGFDRQDERQAVRVQALAERHRVIVPDQLSVSALSTVSRAMDSPFDRWFAGFLEGLGLSQVAVVCTSAFSADVTHYAHVNRGLIALIVVVHAPRPAVGQPISDWPGDAATSLRQESVSLWSADDDAWERIARLVTEETTRGVAVHGSATLPAASEQRRPFHFD